MACFGPILRLLLRTRFFVFLDQKSHFLDESFRLRFAAKTAKTRLFNFFIFLKKSSRTRPLFGRAT